MKDVIAKAIREVLESLGCGEVDFVVEHPNEMAHGDYATNVALVAAKSLGQNPRVLADTISQKLAGEIEYVANISVAGLGFINFTLDRSFFTQEVSRAVASGASWGESDTLSGLRYVVEYTDPNPFKEFHVGHLFTNAVGESIARLCMSQGAEVKRVCYQGDVGLHVAHAVWGIQQLGLTDMSSLTAKDLGKAYVHGATAYKENEEAKAAITALNKTIYERSSEAVNALYDAGRAVSLAYFETIYKTVGTQFDAYFFESEAAPEGKQLVLTHPEVFPQSDGAHIFPGENYGLHTRVFLNQQGLPTYEAKELALAKLKDERLGGYDHSIISTAKEINEYFKVLLCAMGFVYPELAGKTEHIGHGMVRLTTGKMSSRTGEVIPALEFIADVAATAKERIAASGFADATDELATQIAVAAIKYTTLKGNITQDTVFDKERALSFEGDSGPYLQYTHARIKSVLEKAAAAGVVPSAQNVPEESYEIERLIYRFPEVVSTAAFARTPHELVTYLTQLAASFNTFYAHERIADADDSLAPYKAEVAQAVAHTLKNGLRWLGIEAPERM